MSVMSSPFIAGSIPFPEMTRVLNNRIKYMANYFFFIFFMFQGFLFIINVFFFVIFSGSKLFVISFRFVF